MMKFYKKIFCILLIFIFFNILAFSQEIDLSGEYSMDEFRRGIKSFHNCEYEQSITYFIKALSYKDDNHLARYFLGESYRKAGYEKNAIFTWNNLLALGYKDNNLNSKIAYLYNRRGILSEVNINKNYLLREDIKGFYDDKIEPLFLKPAQVFIDSNNHYYISSFLTGRVLELDSNFEIVKNHSTFPDKLNKPFGIAVDKEGFLYVSDFESNVIYQFDRVGLIKNKIGYKGIGNGGLLGPEYIMFDDDDNLYVVDSGNKRINKYKQNGEFLFSFGTKKQGDENIVKPGGMFYYNKHIYVCDRESDRVMIFDKSGNFISSFGEEFLDKPYDIIKDNFGRFLILCEKNIWAYEEENDLWYIVDAPGKRLEKAVSIGFDKNNNILVTDFNRSRLLVMSQERTRYTNLNVNIDRVFSRKFPENFLLLTVENDDFMFPTGVNSSNITVFENGKAVNLSSTSFTGELNKNTDIIVIYDRNENNVKYKDDLIKIMDNWLKEIDERTNIAFVSLDEDEAVLENNFNSTRLSILDSIKRKESYLYTDKGAGIKFSIYHMLPRFSKKAIILLTDSRETGKDFDKFKIDNCIELAVNNNIPIYTVSFTNGNFSDIYRYIAKKTGGEYYRVHSSNNELHNLIKNIKDKKAKELVVSYNSSAVSRFGDEPIIISVEVSFGGMKGVGKSIYYPDNY